jgi:hypothetical protein
MIVTKIVQTLFANNEIIVAKILSKNIARKLAIAIDPTSENANSFVMSGNAKTTKPTALETIAKTIQKLINKRNLAAMILPRAIGLETNKSSVPLSRYSLNTDIDITEL